MENNAVFSGFSDLARDSQASFRATMDAMAHPGKIVVAPIQVDAPAPLTPTTAMLVLTLCDFDSPLWLDHELVANQQVRQFIAFHTSAPIVKNKADAQFAIITDVKELENIRSFALGTDEYPDRSTTLITQVNALSHQDGVTLTGPGIEFSTQLNVSNLGPAFWTQAQANSQLFPRGVDFIFATQTQLACLPRSTKINAKSEAA